MLMTTTSWTAPRDWSPWLDSAVIYEANVRMYQHSSASLGVTLAAAAAAAVAVEHRSPSLGVAAAAAAADPAVEPL